MLEAPEARIYAEQLERTLSGKTIETVIAGFTPHKFAFFNKPAADFEKALTGRRVTGARSPGGMVELIAGDESVVFTDGANIRYLEPGAPLPKSHQLHIGFSDQSCITVSVRMYAGIMLAGNGRPEGHLAEYYTTAVNKPHVLSDGFTREYFLGMASSPELAKTSAKGLLATQQRIPGLGNGVLQDILFNAGIHPKTRVSGFRPGDIDRLWKSIRTTLTRMVEAGGRDSETDLFGRRGGYAATLSKDTAGHPCPVCRSIIVKENYMGGSIYYCPGCQPPDRPGAGRK